MIIVLRLLAECALGIVIALLCRRFFFAFLFVKGNSMLDTLKNRDLLFMLRYGLLAKPHRFDIVICRYPNRKPLFVKRIIALPGERISIEDGCVFINGEALDECFARRKSMGSFAEIQLGNGEYFVMGDNRPSSVDSRRVGPISEKMLLGRAVCRIFPLKSRCKFHP